MVVVPVSMMVSVMVSVMKGASVTVMVIQACGDNGDDQLIAKSVVNGGAEDDLRRTVEN